MQIGRLLFKTQGELTKLEEQQEVSPSEELACNIIIKKTQLNNLKLYLLWSPLKIEVKNAT